LQVQDFILIGQSGFDIKYYNHAFNWFSAALQLTQTPNADLKVRLFLLERLANTSLKVKI